MSRRLVDGLPERPTLNLLLGKRLEQLAGAHAKLTIVHEGRVHPKGALRPRCLWHRQDARNIPKSSLIPNRDLSLSRHIRLQLLQLSTPYSGLKIGQPIVVSDFAVDEFDGIVLCLS